MEPNNTTFNKRNIIIFAVLVLLVVALPVGILLVQQQQRTTTQAAEAQIRFTGSNVNCESNGANCTTTSPTVEVELTSPYGLAPAQ